MKLLTTLVLLLVELFIGPPLNAQNFHPTGFGRDNYAFSFYHDSLSNLLYAGGRFRKVGYPPRYARSIAVYNGHSWDSLNNQHNMGGVYGARCTTFS